MKYVRGYFHLLWLLDVCGLALDFSMFSHYPRGWIVVHGGHGG